MSDQSLPDGTHWLMLELKRMNDSIDKLGVDVAYVKERIIAIEAAAVHKDVETLEKRVATLEADLHQRGGALKAATLLPQLAPWLLAFALLGWRYFGA